MNADMYFFDIFIHVYLRLSVAKNMKTLMIQGSTILASTVCGGLCYRFAILSAFIRVHLWQKT